MTYEEALELLNEHTQYYVPPSDLTAFNMAIEALEKQIPKKPIFTEHILIKGCKPSEMRSCPNCKRFFDVTMIGDDFCKRCGQALDWSDAE